MSRDLSASFGVHWRDLGRTGVFLGLILAVVGASLWWTKVYQDPERVFWAAMNNNLAISGVTVQVEREQQGIKLDQRTQLSLAPYHNARTLTTLTQAGNIVNTESISTIDAEYVRYASIRPVKSEEKRTEKFASVLGVWVKTSAADHDPLTHLFGQTMLGIVPLAHLQAPQRQTIIRTMQSTRAYQPDFKKVQRKVQNGKTVLLYTVQVTPAARAKVLQVVARAAGLKSSPGLNPSMYQANGSPIKLQMAIDPVTRRFVSVNYGNGQLVQRFEGYGITKQVTAPARTISTAELQKRLFQSQ